MTADDAHAGDLAGRLVLVVEDEAFIAMDLQDLLESAGASVLGPAPSAAAALSALSRSRPDVALLDANLRGASSAPVAEALRQAGVPFVVVSGYSREQLADAVLRDAPMLPKPVERRRLLSMLGRMLSGEAV